MIVSIRARRAVIGVVAVLSLSLAGGALAQPKPKPGAPQPGQPTAAEQQAEAARKATDAQRQQILSGLMPFVTRLREIGRAHV